MNKMEYQGYLASREWALKREAVRKRSGSKCERCKKNEMDAVHHLTYIRIGNELLTDLQAICDPCHEFLSGKRDDDPAISAPLAEIKSFYDVINHAHSSKDERLCSQLLWTHLVRFAPPIIELRIEAEYPSDLAARLERFLNEATGIRWTIVRSSEEGEPAFADQMISLRQLCTVVSRERARVLSMVLHSHPELLWEVERLFPDTNPYGLDPHPSSVPWPKPKEPDSSATKARIGWFGTAKHVLHWSSDEMSEHIHRCYPGYEDVLQE